MTDSPDLRTDLQGAMQSIAAGAAPGSFRAAFRFDPALALFGGHFPGRPLVPGVLEIEAVRCAVENLAQKRYNMVRVDRAKFSAAVAPGDVLAIDGTLSPRPPELQVRATLTIGAAAAATILLTLKERSEAHP